MRILKYKLFKEVTGHQDIQIPDKSQILTVQIQADNIVLWAEISEDYPEKKRTFQVILTGELYTKSHDRLYLGTCQNGYLVYHVFEVLRPYRD